MEIKRDIIKKFVEWKNRSERLPLIVQGARQIGKSWAIEEFGRHYYKNIAVFNFDKNKELCDVFEKTKDVKRILSDLQLYSQVTIIEGETLIFFDEIQNCKEALNTLKYFAEDAPQHHIIAAGSLLGVAIRHKSGKDENINSFPVGKVTFINMYPVTFREYMQMANPALLQAVDDRLQDLEELPSIVLNQLQEHYRRYLVCGGLPRPCSHMLDKTGMETINIDLEDLKKAYELDFTKYVEPRDIPRIHEIWKSIPSQLSRENRKFIFRLVREGARAREYDSALNWLVLSGMVYRIYCTEKPLLPLKHYEDTTAFKIYMLDPAVLRSIAELPAEAIIENNNMTQEFKGASAENYVLVSLLAQGFNSPHYWTKQGNKAEVDFLIQQGLDIIPIEVKAGTNIKGQSLAQYDKNYSPRLRIRFSMRNIKKDGNLLNLPLFLCDWLKDVLPQLL